MVPDKATTYRILQNWHDAGIDLGAYALQASGQAQTPVRRYNQTRQNEERAALLSEIEKEKRAMQDQSIPP